MTSELPVPETRYTESDGLSIAYQVFGSGARDLVFVPGIISNLDANWQHDSYVRMMRRLAERFRVICFDKRGQGMSDRFEGVPTLEERMDDVRAVMQAAGSQRTVVLACSEGGAMGALFTATYPALVERLVLFAAMARFSKAPDYPHFPTLAQMLKAVGDTWGTLASPPTLAPSRAGDADFCERLARYQRQTASPSALRRLMIANDQIDVRAILPQVRRPTLIIHRRGDFVIRCANGRYLADHISEAVYLELPGADDLPTEGNTGSGAAVKAANLGRWESSFRQLPGFGRKAYPLQGEVTSPDRRGRRSHGRPASQDARVGATGVASKLVGLNISE